ncbi:hypothetical protein OH782_42210 (plasmid) [Streptomyces sp. NBC_01544]|uniref:hypothetical protein n=1 Tax=Streptomyces sp. NBC_01544 TaxID=2975871 RepID=UPI0038690339
MSSPAERSSALTVDATAHRLSRRSPSVGLCKFRGSLAKRCPAWLEHRTKKTFRVEGWENNGWTMVSGAKPLPRGRAARESAQGPLPQIPMRVVAETTKYMVVSTALAQTSPSEGDQVT